VTPSEALQHIVSLVEASADLKDDKQRKVLLRSAELAAKVVDRHIDPNAPIA
jgi:hypothetical protein